MPAFQITRHFTRAVDGGEPVLADPFSATLSDALGVYGVKRDDTDEAIVAAGTSLTRVSTGIYTYTVNYPSAVETTYTYVLALVGAEGEDPYYETTTVSGEPDLQSGDDPLTDQPFELIKVSPGAIGGAEVSWVPKLDLPWPEPWTFRVDMSYSPAATWTTLTTVASTNWTWLDVTQYKYDFMTKVWYRVVLVDGDGGVHASDPAQIGTYLDRRDWLLAKESCRRAQQRMRLRTGREGHIYKKMDWGELCEDCGDTITGQETNSQCPTCFGTGLVGGYHPPISAWVEMNNEDLSTADDQFSIRYRLKHPVQAINFPKIMPNDLWRDLRSGKIWVVQDPVVSASSMRGLSLITAFQLQPVGVGDVVYQLALPE